MMKTAKHIDACAEIRRLVLYAARRGLILQSDTVYATNRLLAVMGITHYTPGETDLHPLETPAPVLENLLNIAAASGILDPDTSATRDIFDTELMSALTPRPSWVIAEFERRYKVSPIDATDWFYTFSIDTNYIRKDRIDKDIGWKYTSKYGEIHITINLAKPEKDPRDIIAALTREENSYPTCVLCLENEGHRGSQSSPARATHRIIPIDIDKERWFFQYSPYVYYNEHCIALSEKHVPMQVAKETFRKLFCFLDIFPHYFIGSNAGLPIVGGSILSHEHFQGGRFSFPIEQAKESPLSRVRGFERVRICTIDWPMSVLRLRSESKDELIALAEHILACWEAYSDEDVGIFACTGDTPHNTVTPIARLVSDEYELDIVLRNNRTDDAHPYGIFHPANERHHIKKENIGLIEVMGLAVLPPRLKGATEDIAKYLEGNQEAFFEDAGLSAHRDWYEGLTTRYQPGSMDVHEFLRDEIGEVFIACLEDAGVFKRDEAGQKAFMRFIYTCNQ